ncbi:MAG TPA: nucleotidyltransferase domain-containing protein [Bacteroidia bacterium]|nr:nucleotidyltransferase domain-containing protein [Bacteroidia bacterium]
MNKFGTLIRKLRTDKELPLRTVAAYLDIDQAILSKFEHGKRKPTREQVVQLAEFFKTNPDELLIAWLADKVIYVLDGEDELSLKALQVAEDSVEYVTPTKINSTNVIQKLKSFFENDNRISSAWLFGSVSRGEANENSDIDVMIELYPNIKFSMMDMLDIQFQLHELFGRKVDVVEKGFLKDFAVKSVSKDLKLIIKK